MRQVPPLIKDGFVVSATIDWDQDPVGRRWQVLRLTVTVGTNTTYSVRMKGWHIDGRVDPHDRVHVWGRKAQDGWIDAPLIVNADPGAETRPAEKAPPPPRGFPCGSLVVMAIFGVVVVG